MPRECDLAADTGLPKTTSVRTKDNIDRDATFDLWIMAGDVHGLATAMDVIIDDPGQPGIQAILNAILAKSKQLMDLVDTSRFVVKGDDA